MRGERRPSRNSVTLLIKRDALVDETVHLQARDFVLNQQLAALQLHDLKIVDRRMRAGFGNFRFQRPVPSLKLRKVRLYGHVGGFSSYLTLEVYTVLTHFRSGFRLCNAAIPPQSAGLNADRQKRIFLSRFWSSAPRGYRSRLGPRSVVHDCLPAMAGRGSASPGPKRPVGGRADLGWWSAPAKRAT